MATVRPLFSAPERLNYDLADGWQCRIKGSQPSTVRLDDDAMTRIENWVRWYVDTVYINSFSIQHKFVFRHLNVLERRAAKVAAGPTNARLASLADAVHFPDLVNSDEARGRQIALEYVSNGLLCDVETPGSCSLLNRGARARQCLVQMIWSDPASIRRLQRHIQLTQQLLRRTNEETAAHVAPLTGKPLIDGKPFAYQADPHMRRNSRPDGDALAELVSQLCVVYRYLGGTTSVPRDGRPPTPFMRFLSNIVAAMPKARPAGNAVHSRARHVLAGNE